MGQAGGWQFGADEKHSVGELVGGVGHQLVGYLPAKHSTTQMAEQQTEQGIVLLPNEMANDVS